MKLLLVEDDQTIASTLAYILEQADYQVTLATSIEQAEIEMLATVFDFYIFDLGLPDGSGFSLCRYVQENLNKPVLILSAFDDESHVVLGLDLGADDYMVKPFRTRELLSRIKSIARRYEHKNAHIKLDQIEVDIDRAKVYRHNQEIYLSVTEYKLLLILIKHNHRTLTRQQLIDLLWEDSKEFMSDNTLSVNIKRLREKIEENPNEPQWIKTIRGLGYSIDL